MRFLRFNSLSARERLLYFYLSTIRRAEEQGIQRAPVQTPHEYSTVLKQALPEVQPELDDLTEAFIEARYSLHPVTPEQTSGVLSHWKQVQQALRSRRRTN